MSEVSLAVSFSFSRISQAPDIGSSPPGCLCSESFHNCNCHYDKHVRITPTSPRLNQSPTPATPRQRQAIQTDQNSEILFLPRDWTCRSCLKTEPQPHPPATSIQSESVLRFDKSSLTRSECVDHEPNCAQPNILKNGYSLSYLLVSPDPSFDPILLLHSDSSSFFSPLPPSLEGK